MCSLNFASTKKKRTKKENKNQKELVSECKPYIQLVCVCVCLYTINRPKIPIYKKKEEFNILKIEVTSRKSDPTIYAHLWDYYNGVYVQFYFFIECATMNVPLKKRHNYGKLNGSVSSINEPSAKRCKYKESVMSEPFFNSVAVSFIICFVGSFFSFWV